MKILFINNYPMDWAWKAYKNGEYPGHHLWGITHLHKYGIDVDILPHKKCVILNEIGRKLKLGDYLDQQLRILFRWSEYDLIYSACQNNTFFLSVLRTLSRFRQPIVATIHHPLPETLKNKLFIKGHDKILVLSSGVKKKLKDSFGMYEEKFELLEWGVDLPFYELKKSDIAKSEPMFIISAGKTQRDHDTLVKAFNEINYPLKIYCSAESAPTISQLSSNIKVQYNHPTENAISYKELLAEYERAYAIAIPLKGTDNLAGLTSLLDSMAVGKAVIMTKNKEIDIDIEKEGIGIWVEPGDVKGWQQAITYLLAHPDETMEMGNRARHLCQSKYNLEMFSSKLAEIIKSVFKAHQDCCK